MIWLGRSAPFLKVSCHIRESAVTCRSACLGSLDLSLALVLEVLGQSWELCLTHEDVEATDLIGDGVLLGSSAEADVVAHFFPSAWEREDFLLEGGSK